MARIDKVSDSGRFRAFAAAGLNDVAGNWGDGELLCVQVDASGTLSLGAAPDCDGVILTTEGRNNPDATNYKKVIGGREYTVFTAAEIVEMGEGTDPTFSAGDLVYAGAAGDVEVASPASGAIFLGYIMDSADRFVLRLNAKAPFGEGS
jgi:hypothetical protein